jgi:hypothetical protein
MIAKAGRSHDEVVVEMLRADPEFAEAYLAAALEEAEQPGGGPSSHADRFAPHCRSTRHGKCGRERARHASRFTVRLGLEATPPSKLCSPF